MHQVPEGSPEQKELETLLANLTAERAALSAGLKTVSAMVSLPSSGAVGSLLRSSAASSSPKDKIEYLADLSATETRALQAQHDTARTGYLAFERSALSQIEKLAAESGLDVEAYRRTRDVLEAERADAERRGDRVDLYRLDAVIAGHTVHGLKAVGADEAILAEAETQRRNARDRYLTERAVETLSVGRAQGLSGVSLTRFVEEDRQSAISDLDTRDAALRAEVASQVSQTAATEIATHVTERDASWERAAQQAKAVLTAASSPVSGDTEGTEPALGLPALPDLVLDLSVADELVVPDRTPSVPSADRSRPR
ncbi:hypothetical protein JANAI62_37580 [Jannaschia pagri]|uniref:Uncharacterized protein n=1 Tax=Jannaschia pagri TaxID=2829797 RepID=A0ABQ4NRW7_9RHOB|nr:MULTISPECIES: hypothetical protein [unclassified Jannaschia]GIT93335.1 hypothetical protein JANAI61_37930 [Jannaschia sp. AI_61]GIT97135.1 hypothetical protein JANAI62_37580 [Jannaschia sp. AI_62]